MPSAPPKGCLLVVDDHADSRHLLMRIFVKEGYDVVEASSGTMALDLISEREFDLVLLDIVMPGLDGVEVLKHIRARYSPLQLPVMMVTGFTEGEKLARANELGANDYVTKPIDPALVLARAQDLVRRKRDTAATSASS